MLVPNLRFKEFSNDWKQKQIIDVAPLQRGFDLPSNKLVNGKYPVVYSNGILNYHNEYKCKPFGVVTGRSGTIGKFTFVDKEYYPHNTSLWVTNFNGNNPKFVYYLYHTINIENYASGSTVPTLNRNDVHKHLVYIPSLEEQTKISNFLTLIDKKIELQQKLVENLNLYKKGLLQKIFSNNQNWKIKKLADFLIEYNQKTTINNQYPVLTSSRKGLFLQRDYFDKQVASDNNIGYNILPYNYITYRNASDDATFYFNINNIIECGIVSPLYPVFTTKDMNIIFLQLILNYSNEFKKYCLEQQQGGTRTSMSINKLKEFKIKLPSLEEQNRIAELFTNLDKKIEFETNKLNNLKEYKKGLLQQMFI